MNVERVTFTADGLTLVGNLTVAADGARAVVPTGPFSGVKEQVVGAYAARLRERGLTTLAFDHRGFGESGGRRAHQDSPVKASSPIRAAATDPRIRAVVGFAGAYNSPIRLSTADPDSHRRSLSSFIDPP